MRIGIGAGNRIASEALRRAVGEGTPHSVEWVARDGGEAERRLRRTPIDLLLLDVDIGGIDAVELTRRVMKDGTAAILLVTGKDASIGHVFEAMGLGALDVVAAPSLDAEGELHGDSALKARLAVVEKLITSLSAARPASASKGEATTPPLVAIGASTGGPEALAVILEKLPKDLGAALLIVQHIDHTFADGLASWLTERTRFPVTLAAHGDRPKRSHALLASTEDHMVLAADRTIAYTPEPTALVHRPSVDVFFGSLSPIEAPGLAILLTGMGRDGAEGLLRLRRSGWTTICQDPRSAVVEGMPRAAVEIGAAVEVLPLPAIPASIAAFAASRAKRP